MVFPRNYGASIDNRGIMTQQFLPPVVPLPQLDAHLTVNGFAIVDAADAPVWLSVTTRDLADFQACWTNLPSDAYLKDSGNYRRRRHSCFIVNGVDAVQVPHRAHWQPVAYNALHGGMERLFEPMEARTTQLPAFQALLKAGAAAADSLRGAQPWYVEAHQFRIDTSDGIGRPTPEGAHRDGVDLVMVALVSRVAVKGGESRVFEANAPQGQRFTMTTPWTTLLLDDARMIHETTPIQPEDAMGWRDTLVLTFRANAFQGVDAG
jgi:hypothetical protein